MEVGAECKTRPDIWTFSWPKCIVIAANQQMLQQYNSPHDTITWKLTSGWNYIAYKSAVLRVQVKCTSQGNSTLAILWLGLMLLLLTVISPSWKHRQHRLPTLSLPSGQRIAVSTLMRLKCTHSALEWARTCSLRRNKATKRQLDGQPYLLWKHHCAPSQFSCCQINKQRHWGFDQCPSLRI